MTQIGALLPKFTRAARDVESRAWRDCDPHIVQTWSASPTQHTPVAVNRNIIWNDQASSSLNTNFPREAPSNACRKKLKINPSQPFALHEITAPSVVEEVLKGPLRREDNPKYPSMDVSEDPEFAQCELELAFPPKPPIKCVFSGKSPGDLIWTKVALIFTHGAGGTLKADTVRNFTHGFVTSSASPTLLYFQGNMNLASRVKMFKTIIEAQKAELGNMIKPSPGCLGGRSMGARAAVMAATQETTHLVLVSYPLQNGKETRDQILLDLPASVNVIFVSGELDDMCDLERLETVRQKMKCKTWKVVVHGADHGMNVKPKSGTQEVGRMIGALVTTWLEKSNEHLTEGTVSWDTDKAAAQWSGWSEAEKSPEANANTAKTVNASAKPMKPAAKPSKRKGRKYLKDEGDTKEVQAPRPRKRRKA